MLDTEGSAFKKPFRQTLAREQLWRIGDLEQLRKTLKNIEVKDVGAETLTIAGRKVETKIIELRFDLQGQTSSTKMWISGQVPGAMCKSVERFTITEITIETTDFSGELLPMTKADDGAPPPAVAPFDEAQAKKHQQDWSAHVKQPVIGTNSIGMKLALIPPGEFLMGSPETEPQRYDTEAKNHAGEGPQHKVRITKPFYIGVHEVTQGQWEKATGKNPAENQESPDHPVEQVTWFHALEFCKKLSELPDERKASRTYRLPTEAEWEYACRAGTTTAFHFGNSQATKHANVGSGAKPGQSVRVGSYAANAWGLYDMHGNVWEWCQDGPRPFPKDVKALSQTRKATPATAAWCAAAVGIIQATTAARLAAAPTSPATAAAVLSASASSAM